MLKSLSGDQPGNRKRSAYFHRILPAGQHNNPPESLTHTYYAQSNVLEDIAADLTYNMSKVGTTTSRRAIMNIGFDFNLTPKWKIHGRSGYDFVGTEFSTTNITILRDFHDWEMGFNWTPFGRFASYQFDLRLKTGPLRDMLRLRLPQSDIPDRFGQLTN